MPGTQAQNKNDVQTEREAIRWFLMVRHHDRATFEAKGWAFASDLGPVHGAWSVLMEFTGNEEQRRAAGLSAE